jgi:hypothetical protein
MMVADILVSRLRNVLGTCGNPTCTRGVLFGFGVGDLEIVRMERILHLRVAGRFSCLRTYV